MGIVFEEALSEWGEGGSWEIFYSTGKAEERGDLKKIRRQSGSTSLVKI
jgi:hypothetical protein